MKKRKSRGCKCKTTLCMNGYCRCLAANDYCDVYCACQGCENQPNNEDNVLYARATLAFKKYSKQALPGVRCSCLKSKCLKNYCPCFEASYNCNEDCVCQGCRNTSDSEDGGQEEVVKRQGSSSTKATTTSFSVLNLTGQGSSSTYKEQPPTTPMMLAWSSKL